MSEPVFDQKKSRLVEWAIKHAQGPHGTFWLSFVAFTESSFFPLPPGVLLVAILLANHARRWVYYAGITTAFSVLGGVFGYVIGAALFETIGQKVIMFYELENSFAVVSGAFSDHAFLAIFAAAFTPIPYKVFTIAAGVFHIDLFVFIVASIAGRAIRYFAIAGLVRQFGEHISSAVRRYFNTTSLFLVLLLIFLIYLLV